MSTFEILAMKKAYPLVLVNNDLIARNGRVIRQDVLAMSSLLACASEATCRAKSSRL
jgi:hypothetical protein